MGWHDQGELNIVLDPNNVEQVLLVDDGENIGSAMLSKFHIVFSSNVGKIHCFEHQIILKDSSKPKIHKLCSFPLSIRKKVSNELLRVDFS